MANIFLTVVGANDYKQTDYRFNDNVCSEERFVQKALLRMLREEGEHFDRIIFFLTKKARDKNWEKYKAAYPNKSGIIETDEGLQPFLEKIFPGIYEAIDICDGVNESEQLDLFNSMYDAIGENDEITFDITHGFRSIPFLFFPVMSYAKQLKKISIKRICYGLFNTDSIITEIIDLKPYAEILDCANAAHIFESSGNSAEICDVIRKRVATMPDTEKRVLGKYNNIADWFSKLTEALLTCQGGTQKFSIPHKASELIFKKQRLETYSDKEHQIFNNLIAHALSSAEKLASSQSPYELGMNAVEWYMDKGLILQAYTALRETITTFFCCMYAPSQDIDDAQFRQKAVDRAITASTSRGEKKPTVSAGLDSAVQLLNDASLIKVRKNKQYAAAFAKIICHVDFDKMSFINNITEMRNTMDHFGMRKSSVDVKLKDIQNHYEEVRELMLDIEERKDSILTDDEALARLKEHCSIKKGTFVNFSNHPSAGWSDKQISAANELCQNGGIVDIPFPGVAANMSEEEICQTSAEYAEKIMQLSPAVVMCMGEFGVCYKVVEMLKSKGVTVVYSCSERNATEQHTDSGTTKTSVFSFVRFRQY